MKNAVFDERSATFVKQSGTYADAASHGTFSYDVRTDTNRKNNFTIGAAQKRVNLADVERINAAK